MSSNFEHANTLIGRYEVLRSELIELARWAKTNPIWAQQDARRVAEKLRTLHPRLAGNITFASHYTISEPDCLAWYARAAAFELCCEIADMRSSAERKSFDVEMATLAKEAS